MASARGEIAAARADASAQKRLATGSEGDAAKLSALLGEAQNALGESQKRAEFLQKELEISRYVFEAAAPGSPLTSIELSNLISHQSNPTSKPDPEHCHDPALALTLALTLTLTLSLSLSLTSNMAPNMAPNLAPNPDPLHPSGNQSIR